MHANLGIASFLKESKKKVFLLNTEFFGVNANYQTMDRKCVLLENMRAKKFKLFGKLKNIKKSRRGGRLLWHQRSLSSFLTPPPCPASISASVIFASIIS